jgi:HK97 family phage portal protein
VKLFGYDLTLTKQKALSPVSDSNRGWITLIKEPFTGAWQKGVEVDRNLVTTHFAVWACTTLIARDIAKLGSPEFKRKVGNIWVTGESPAYTPLLRKPNQFQTPNQFWENWILSKLTYGNTYALKSRDERGVVTRLWIMDPNNVQVLVSDSGDVFYNLSKDNISGTGENATVPASEIIHDRMNCIFHPLVGLSPIYAAGLSATIGLNILNNSASFFGNRAVPSGIITTPNTIPNETADRLKREWESKYKIGGEGGTAILGDGLEFKPMMMTASDSQMIEQLQATAEWVCSCFHVPLSKVFQANQTYNNVEAFNVEYYNEAIQSHLEDIETLLLSGLEMKKNTMVEFCLDGLFRMDTKAQAETVEILGRSAVMAPNESRAKFNLPPVKGGEAPLSQQQNFSLEALAKRDAKPDPFATAKPEGGTAPKPEAAPTKELNNGELERERRLGGLQKGFFSNVVA